MFFAFVAHTPRGHFAHKVLGHDRSEAERHVAVQYKDLQGLEYVGQSDDANGHALYDKALALARKHAEAESLFE